MLIRWGLSITLVFFIYGETGWATALFAGLVIIGLEIVASVLKQYTMVQIKIQQGLEFLSRIEMGSKGDSRANKQAEDKPGGA